MVLIVFVPRVALPAGQPEIASLSLPQRVWIASQLYSLINTYFGHWRGVPDLDLDKEYRSYLDKVLATSDRREFDLASMELIAKLRNGHSGFDDEWLRDNYGQQFGFYAYPVDGRWLVTRSSLADLKAGDVITRIDGREIDDVFQGLRPYISASDERWARRSFFEYPYLFPESFSLELEGGRKLSITRSGRFEWPGSEYSDIESRELDGVPYIRIPSFDHPKFEEAAVQALQKFADANAIIIDVRGNHGGSTPEKLVAALMDRAYGWYAEATPVSMGLFRFQKELGKHSEIYWYGDVQKPAAKPYRGALYILVDGGCFSACEDFVVPFKNNHRAILVGERTAGSSGQPFSAALGDGMGIGLSTKREFFPDGSEFEGMGVVPDVEVHLTVDDVRNHKDPALAKARQLAQEHPPR